MWAGLSRTDLDAGLVFGRTLAELLALLLIALLFGLAALLHHAGREGGKPASALTPTETGRPAPNAGTPSQAGASPNYDAGAQLRDPALETALRDARRENEALRASVSELGRFRDIAEAAARINPNAPAGVLQDAVRVLELLGPTSDPVRALQQLKADSEAGRAAQRELQEYQRLLEAAIKIDPNAPPAQTLQRALMRLDAADETTDATGATGRALRPDSDESRPAGNARDDAAAADPARAANGSGTQPCWVNQSGEAEYLFEITLRNDHLTLRDLAPATRARDAGYRLSRPLLRRARLDADEFRKGTAALLQTSIAQGCRYVVQMRDNTAPDSKEAYKMWRSLIESYFFVKPVS